jgi:Fe-S-cluster-containing hydrogenase component 2
MCQTRCQMDALLDGDGDALGKIRVDHGRCIGCGLCVITCPSGALRLAENPRRKVPPDDTKALYMQLLQGALWSLGNGETGRAETARHEVLSAHASVIC